MYKAVPRNLGLASEDEWKIDKKECLPILQAAAKLSTGAAYELLGVGEGGLSGPKTLYFAIEAATGSGRDEDNREEKEESSIDVEYVRS
jgi:hypothetical protein